MRRKFRLPALSRLKSTGPRALRNLGGALTGLATILAQPGLHVDPFHAAVVGAVGVGLGVVGKWLEGHYADTATTPTPSTVPAVVLWLPMVAMLATACTTREPEPVAPAAFHTPGKPPRVVRRSVTDNRPMHHYLRRQRANHRKPKNWH